MNWDTTRPIVTSVGSKVTCQQRLKRAIDIVVAGFGLVVCGPILLVVAGLVAVFVGRPVLFAQARPGYLGKPFRLVKFRTMRDATGPDGRLLNDEERLTPFGTFLRRTSLDELPQLWNVLNGEMSLVGPRPLLMEYLPRYTPAQRRRHEVRPGITGWAQVRGRNAIGWDAKFAYDLWYVDHWSLWLDLKILVLTVSCVVKRRGISGGGVATMTHFTGSSEESG